MHARDVGQKVVDFFEKSGKPLVKKGLNDESYSLIFPFSVNPIFLMFFYEHFEEHFEIEYSTCFPVHF